MCTVEKCQNQQFSKGLCKAHYARFRSHGDYNCKPRPVQGACTAPGCTTPAKTMNLCSPHYDRFRRFGDLNYSQPFRNTSGKCMAPNCHRPPSKPTGRHCKLHQERLRRSGALDLPTKGVCSAPDCQRQSLAKGLCQAHYDRFRRFGDLNYTKPHCNTTGLCAVGGCTRKPSGQYCTTHLNRLHKFNSTDLPNRTKPCPGPQCTHRITTASHCSAHMRQLKAGQVLTPLRMRRKAPVLCTVDGCVALGRVKGLCGRHYDLVYSQQRRERMHRHYENNKAYYRAKKLKREHSQKLATPGWLSPEQMAAMNQLYKECPIGCEVDHIVPINGYTVCGLHVPWNLQYLSIADNRAKSNKL